MRCSPPCPAIPHQRTQVILHRTLCSSGTCYCTSHLTLELSQVPRYYPPCPYPWVRCILRQWLCQYVYVFPGASDSHVAVGATCVGSAVPAGAQHAAGHGQMRVACGPWDTSQGWAEPPACWASSCIWRCWGGGGSGTCQCAEDMGHGAENLSVAQCLHVL